MVKIKNSKRPLGRKNIFLHFNTQIKLTTILKYNYQLSTNSFVKQLDTNKVLLNSLKFNIKFLKNS